MITRLVTKDCGNTMQKQDKRLNEHDTEITVIKSKIELQHEVE